MGIRSKPSASRDDSQEVLRGQLGNSEAGEKEIGMSAIRGSCLCGGVKFEINGPLSSPLNCHCSQCRKQHGAAFRSRVRVQIQDFRWLQGEHLVKYYESAGGYLRGFCRECGSPILNRAGPNWKGTAQFPRTLSQYGIPLAILDDPPVRPQCHVFVGSKAPWFEITDDLPQHEEYAPSS
jgi:hypothetical protein